MFMVLINVHRGACSASNFMMYFKQIGLVFVYKNWSTMRCIVLFRLYEKVFKRKKNRTISFIHVLASFFFLY